MHSRFKWWWLSSHWQCKYTCNPAMPHAFNGRTQLNWEVNPARLPGCHFKYQNSMTAARLSRWHTFSRRRLRKITSEWAYKWTSSVQASWSTGDQWVPSNAFPCFVCAFACQMLRISTTFDLSWKTRTFISSFSDNTICRTNQLLSATGKTNAQTLSRKNFNGEVQYIFL